MNKRLHMDILHEIESAIPRIRHGVLQTPLLHSRYLSSLSGGRVFLKMESEQYTGSFKARGSLNKLKWLRETQEDFFPVTASTGNHGLGVARALAMLDLDGRIYLPETAVPSKVEAIRAYGADIEFFGDDPYDTEMHARKMAGNHASWVYISPYNDPQVIGGQGTIGAEILEQLEQPDHVLATVGGGGLISGIGTWIKAHAPGTRIIGCQPHNSPEMSASVEAGRYVDTPSSPTLSDGSAGGFERDAITFDLCRHLVDRFLLVSEEEIETSIRLMIDKHSKLVEGAAGVAVACFTKNAAMFAGGDTVIVICGANISRETLKQIL